MFEVLLVFIFIYIQPMLWYSFVLLCRLRVTKYIPFHEPTLNIPFMWIYKVNMGPLMVMLFILVHVSSLSSFSIPCLEIILTIVNKDSRTFSACACQYFPHLWYWIALLSCGLDEYDALGIIGWSSLSKDSEPETFGDLLCMMGWIVATWLRWIISSDVAFMLGIRQYARHRFIVDSRFADENVLWSLEKIDKDCEFSRRHVFWFWFKLNRWRLPCGMSIGLFICAILSPFINEAVGCRWSR